MPVIAVVNRKGGSGKSTLATNIAAWCAHNGWQVMLGDVDRQRSMNSWLSRRRKEAPPVTTWAVDRSRTVRPPSGTTHVVLDTPGALYDHHLAKLVVNVDALVVPIGPSVFDRDASLDFLAELRLLPRISSGRCLVVAVGMRWPEEERQRWLAGGKQWVYPLLTVIPERSVYRTCVEDGASIFDVPQESASELQPWKPLMAWLKEMWSEDFQTNRQAARSGTFEHNSPSPESLQQPGRWRPPLAKSTPPTLMQVKPALAFAQSTSNMVVPARPAVTLGPTASATATQLARQAPSVHAATTSRPGWWQRWFGASH